MASLRDEVLATIKQVQKNTRDPHTPEEALQIAQIKALLLIAQVLASLGEGEVHSQTKLRVMPR